MSKRKNQDTQAGLKRLSGGNPLEAESIGKLRERSRKPAKKREKTDKNKRGLGIKLPRTLKNG